MSIFRAKELLGDLVNNKLKNVTEEVPECCRIHGSNSDSMDMEGNRLHTPCATLALLEWPSVSVLTVI